MPEINTPLAGSLFGATHTAKVTEIPARIVRCSCEQCGAHTNAVWSFRIGGSCPTCGSFRLAPVVGAEVMEHELVA